MPPNHAQENASYECLLLRRRVHRGSASDTFRAAVSARALQRGGHVAPSSCTERVNRASPAPTRVFGAQPGCCKRAGANAGTEMPLLRQGKGSARLCRCPRAGTRAAAAIPAGGELLSFGYQIGVERDFNG